MAFDFIRRLFGAKKKSDEFTPLEDPPTPVVTTADLGMDPLNPHGDGTIRPGDPLWDMLMSGGGAVHAERKADGTWEVTELD